MSLRILATQLPRRHPPTICSVSNVNSYAPPPPTHTHTPHPPTPTPPPTPPHTPHTTHPTHHPPTHTTTTTPSTPHSQRVEGEQLWRRPAAADLCVLLHRAGRRPRQALRVLLHGCHLLLRLVQPAGAWAWGQAFVFSINSFAEWCNLQAAGSCHHACLPLAWCLVVTQQTQRPCGHRNATLFGGCCAVAGFTGKRGGASSQGHPTPKPTLPPAPSLPAAPAVPWRGRARGERSLWGD